MTRTIAALSLILLRSAIAAPIDFETQVYPVLKDNCIACHNKTTTKAGLNMETPELMMKGGETDKGILPGKGAESIIYQAAAHTWDSDMPPKSNKVGAKNLTPEELALLKQWIDEGAKHSAKQERLFAWQPLPAALKAIYAVALTPDGHFAAAARANQISIYHLPARALATRLTDDALIKSGLYKQPGIAHRDVVECIAFSPDGTRLATGSYREVKLWKRPTAALKPAPAIPATPPGKFSIQLAPPNVANLINTADGKTLRAINHVGITAACISRDDQRIATTGTDHRIKIWELATGKLILEIKGDLASESTVMDRNRTAAAAALEVAWQKEAITRAQKDVTDLEARLKKANELAELAKKALEDKRKDAKTKADAKTAADKAAKDAADLLAKVPADKPDEALKKKATEAQEKAEKAASDAMLASEALTRAEAAITDTANEIRLVNQAATNAKKTVADAQAAQTTATKSLETANAAKTAATAAQANALPALIALTFSPTAQQIAGITADGVVHVYSTLSASPISTTPTAPLAGKVTSITWPTAAGWTVTGEKGTFLCADLTHAAWSLERTLGSGDGKSPITDRANSLAFSADGKTLAIGSGEPSRSGDVTLWEVSTGELTQELPEIHIDSVLSIDFSPDGKLLATGGADKAVRVIDLATGKVIKTFEGHTHHVLGIAWRSDGRILSSAGADNAVKVWDWTIGDRRKNVDGWDKEVTAIRYLGASDTAATSAGDSKIRLINSDGGEIKQLPGSKDFMNALSSSRDGDLIAAGGQDGVLRLWQVSTGKEVGTFE
ncbi:MAG: hypothetical protein KDK97_01525 [Verrucomicrobiales bacterium]|nr:hypothetical protein [Verrucomicrobiales bacterium]MCP5559484.1 hypothetical protein [Verrucomicrobiaceae bacterium]